MAQGLKSAVPPKAEKSAKNFSENVN